MGLGDKIGATGTNHMGHDTDRELLARIDERTLQMQKDFEAFKATIVTQDEFKPIKSIVYGVVGLIMLSVFGALIAIVVRL